MVEVVAAVEAVAVAATASDTCRKEPFPLLPHIIVQKRSIAHNFNRCLTAAEERKHAQTISIHRLYQGLPDPIL